MKRLALLLVLLLLSCRGSSLHLNAGKTFKDESYSSNNFGSSGFEDKSDSNFSDTGGGFNFDGDDEYFVSVGLEIQLSPQEIIVTNKTNTIRDVSLIPQLPLGEERPELTESHFEEMIEKARVRLLEKEGLTEDRFSELLAAYKQLEEQEESGGEGGYVGVNNGRIEFNVPDSWGWQKILAVAFLLGITLVGAYWFWFRKKKETPEEEEDRLHQEKLDNRMDEQQ